MKMTGFRQETELLESISFLNDVRNGKTEIKRPHSPSNDIESLLLLFNHSTVQ